MDKYCWRGGLLSWEKPGYSWFDCKSIQRFTSWGCFELLCKNWVQWWYEWWWMGSRHLCSMLFKSDCKVDVKWHSRSNNRIFRSFDCFSWLEVKIHWVNELRSYSLWSRWKKNCVSFQISHENYYRFTLWKFSED